MQSTFASAIRLLLGQNREGGFSDNPLDPGGVTNHGVTQRQWEFFLGHPVSAAGMEALTPAAVTPFYKRRYWDAVMGDALPAGIDYCVFDFAVNSGPREAILTLQRQLGVTADASLGAVTLTAVRHQLPSIFIPAYETARLAYLRALDGWPTFGQGWQTRVEAVGREAQDLAGQVGV